MKFAFTFFIMSLYWVLLSGHFDMLHLALGLFSCLLVSFLITPVLFRFGSPGWGGIRFCFRFVNYLPRFTLEVIMANIDLAYRTL
ncbi:MAG: Na+/H+ antiporter subunit E, partial [Nitrospinota bacterium]